MHVDKNLFIYNLSVVAIMKNEGPYAKEWLDFHLLAGVEHFYLYDNDSPDNLKEVLQPYINAGLVTYTFYPGKCRQMEAYIDAVHRFKFQSRYIAFIDADEFIFPQNNKNIVEVVDEILADKNDVGGLSVNWCIFGSNYNDKADYNKGVLERFTRRDLKCVETVKTISNPRKIKVFHMPHNAQYFEGIWAINEIGNIVPHAQNSSLTNEKISINHYHTKSYEEYQIKINRSRADILENTYKKNSFSHEKNNDVYDDSILKYRDEKLSNLKIIWGGG